MTNIFVCLSKFDIFFCQATRCTADMRSSVSFDFESEASVDLLFYATDKEGLKISKQITLTIGDANDPPTVSCNQMSFFILSNFHLT